MFKMFTLLKEAVGVSMLVVCFVSIVNACSKSSDCGCGSQCVTPADTLCNTKDKVCSCQEGCAVFDIFIAQGRSRVPVYGNTCSCRGKPSVFGGIPACSRTSWWNEPEGIDVYHPNPGCD